MKFIHIGVHANRSTSGFAEDAQKAPSSRRVIWLGQTGRTKRDISDCHDGRSRRDPSTADAPSVKDPQSNQLSSMLAMAEDRAFRGRQARLVEASTSWRSGLCKRVNPPPTPVPHSQAHPADAKSAPFSGSAVSKHAICSLRVCRVSEFSLCVASGNAA